MMENRGLEQGEISSVEAVLRTTSRQRIVHSKRSTVDIWKVVSPRVWMVRIGLNVPLFARRNQSNLARHLHTPERFWSW